MDKNNPNDFKVVEFFNSTNFDFTPELGAMFDGRPFFVSSGEKRQYPYHVGHRLAVNLAKAVLIKGAPSHDPNSNNPIGTPIWSEEKLESLKKSFLTELYTETKPISMSQTDILMAKVAELEKLFQDKQKAVEPKVESKEAVAVTDGAKTYQDKAEVILELEKRGIVHDKRKKKEELEKLLA